MGRGEPRSIHLVTVQVPDPCGVECVVKVIVTIIVLLCSVACTTRENSARHQSQEEDVRVSVVGKDQEVRTREFAALVDRLQQLPSSLCTNLHLDRLHLGSSGVEGAKEMELLAGTPMEDGV